MTYAYLLFLCYGVLTPGLMLLLFIVRFQRESISSLSASVSSLCWLLGGILAVYWLSFGLDTWRLNDLSKMAQFLVVYPALFWYVLALLMSKELFALPGVLLRSIQRSGKWVYTGVAKLIRKGKRV